MNRTARWAAVVVVSLLVFAGCAALLIGVHFPWTPRSESDRWFVALTVATFLGATVGGPLAWWAGREEAPGGGAKESAEAVPGTHVTQRAKVGRSGTNIMAGRDLRMRHDGRPGHEQE